MKARITHTRNGTAREFMLWITLTQPGHPAALQRTRAMAEPSEAEIQRAAYSLWMDEGRPEGRELDHWLTAREILMHRPGRVAQGRAAVPRRSRGRHGIIVLPPETGQSN